MKNKDEFFRALKFTFFSASAGLIQIGTFALFSEIFKMHYWGSYLCSLILSILWNFTLNRNFTFKSATNVPIAMIKVACFYAVFTPVTTIGGNYIVGLGINKYIVEICTMALNFITEYIYDRFFVFGNSINTKQN